MDLCPVSAGNGKMPSARVILAVRRDVEISRNIKKNTTIPAALILKLRLAENIVWSNKAVHWRVCPLSAVDGLLVENWPSSSHQRGPTTPHIIRSWFSSNFPFPPNQLVFWCSPMFALSEQINVDPIINYIVRRANQIIFCLTSTPADRRPLE